MLLINTLENIAPGWGAVVCNVHYYKYVTALGWWDSHNSIDLL